MTLHSVVVLHSVASGYLGAPFVGVHVMFHPFLVAFFEEDVRHCGLIEGLAGVAWSHVLAVEGTTCLWMLWWMLWLFGSNILVFLHFLRRCWHGSGYGVHD